MLHNVTNRVHLTCTPGSVGAPGSNPWGDPAGPARPRNDPAPQGPRRGGPVVAEVVDRSARLRLPVEHAGQADVYGFRVGTEYPARHRGSRGDAPAALLGVFRGRHLGPHGRRPARDRIDPGRRSRPVAGYDDRRARISARGGHPSQRARRPRFGSRSAAKRSSPPASTASGKRARAGRWPASSRPAIACG